ncbi:hypothetical protein [Paenibacillus oryzisoli]|uniref:Uncharacterized protein n=1 Tax=Paenibacillus oryzisoli TaxID=1850517 RepID=A0A198A5I6_9BACL|nr:hypothetical protein [Paenibacillus oryzisoli]OAS16385.1 hypothetical protein A8708_20425 [Paenibacillus oryzisoli]
MKLYERSMKAQLAGVCMFFFLSLVQLIINISAHSPVGFVVIFSFCLGIFLILVVIISIDLVQNDAEKMVAKVEFVEEFRIHIRKPNGKLLKLRVKAAEYEQFHGDQLVELRIAKRTSALLSIYSVEEKQKDGFQTDENQTDDL